MENNELKPCPFCGKQPWIFDHDCGWMVECINDDCCIQPGHFDSYHRREKAVETWNRRASLDELTQLGQEMGDYG